MTYKLTDVQSERLFDYAPQDIYTHADGSPVVFIWSRESVELHRVMPDGSVRVVTRAFDRDSEWQHDILHADLGPQA